jgi:hypothetical protein
MSRPPQRDECGPIRRMRVVHSSFDSRTVRFHDGTPRVNEFLIAGERRAKAASLDPEMRRERWDAETEVRFDRRLWAELCTLGFLEDVHNVLILGGVGVGKTMLASCLGPHRLPAAAAGTFLPHRAPAQDGARGAS